MLVARILVLLSVLACSVAFPQPAMLMRDGSGQQLGWLLDATEKDGSVLVIQRSDGYLMRIQPVENGARFGPYSGFQERINYLAYEEQNCQGQPYLNGTSGGSFLGWRGGEYFQFGSDEESNGFARIDWGAVGELKLIESKKDPSGGGCENFSNPNPQWFWPVTEIDPATIGVQKLPSGIYGYPRPITPEFVQPDGVFCNGFENCPAGE